MHIPLLDLRQRSKLKPQNSKKSTYLQIKHILYLCFLVAVVVACLFVLLVVVLFFLPCLLLHYTLEQGQFKNNTFHNLWNYYQCECFNRNFIKRFNQRY